MCGRRHLAGVRAMQKVPHSMLSSANVRENLIFDADHHASFQPSFPFELVSWIGSSVFNLALRRKCLYGLYKGGRMARPKADLVLSADERQKLESWASRPKSSQRLALRARIVLACADEPINKAVAVKLGVCNATIGTWRRRFVAHRLDGLTDDPRPGAPRSVTDAHIEDVVTKTLETKPKAATHWSTRTMAKATGMCFASAEVGN